MENSNLSAVSSLNDKREETQALIELDGASRVLSIPSFAWDLTVQQVLRVAGLTANEYLLNENVAPTAGSPAHVLGHQTLRSLVEGSQKDNGLQQDWVDFRAKMTALVYRQKYSITENDYQEINALFEDASEILGRSPIDSAEFHGAKQKALAERVEQLVADKSRMQSDFERTTQNLKQDLLKKTSEVEQVRSDAQRVSAEAAQSIQDMHRETARLQETSEANANARIEEARKTAVLETQRKLTELRDSLQGQISAAEGQRLVAEGELADLRARINAGEYVAKSELEALTEKLSAIRMSEVGMRNDLLAVNQQLTDERLISAGLREELARASQARVQEREHIESLEGRLATIINDRTQSAEFAVMHERLTLSKDENAALSAELVSQKGASQKLERKFHDVLGAYKELRKSGRQYCDSLKGQIGTLETKHAAIYRELTHVKIALAVTLTCGTGASIALVLKHMGVI